MDKAQVKFGEWMENGFNLYKNNFIILVLASLVACILSVVTFFVLAGPMIAGVLLITMALFDKQEPKPEVGDLFKGFNYFLNSFLFPLALRSGQLIQYPVLTGTDRKPFFQYLAAVTGMPSLRYKAPKPR